MRKVRRRMIRIRLIVDRMRQKVYSKGEEIHNENKRSVISKDKGGQEMITADKERISAQGN